MPTLQPQDNVVATYREHGHALLRGVAMNAIMAEMYGKQRGLLARPRRLDAPVRPRRRASSAATRSSAAACRWPSGWRWPTRCTPREDCVTACFFGEGAVAEGAFHESLNLAALWHLPVLFVCENNLYAMGTALSRSRVADRPDAPRRRPTASPTAHVDGMNVLAVHDAARQAVAQVRAQGSAVLPRTAHLPLPRPLDVRRRAVPRQGGGRALEAAWADPHLHRPAEGGGHADRGRVPGASTATPSARSTRRWRSPKPAPGSRAERACCDDVVAAR